MYGSFLSIPFVAMRKGITVITVLNAAKPCEDIICILVDIAPHALPKLVTAWHLGHDQVYPLRISPPVTTISSIGKGSLHKWQIVVISGWIGGIEPTVFIMVLMIAISSSEGNFSHSPS
jgi:hypothetical protein